MGKEHIKFQSYNMSTMYCNLLDCLHIDNEMPQDTDLLHLWKYPRIANLMDTYHIKIVNGCYSKPKGQLLWQGYC